MSSCFNLKKIEDDSYSIIWKSELNRLPCKHALELLAVDYGKPTQNKWCEHRWKPDQAPGTNYVRTYDARMQSKSVRRGQINR